MRRNTIIHIIIFLLSLSTHAQSSHAASQFSSVPPLPSSPSSSPSLPALLEPILIRPDHALLIRWSHAHALTHAADEADLASTPAPTPQLTYSVFASWQRPHAAGAAGDERSVPTRRICMTRGPVHECQTKMIPNDATRIELQIMVTSQTGSDGATDDVIPPVLSKAFVFTSVFDSLIGASIRLGLVPLPASSVQLLQNDTLQRDTLCHFFDATHGSSWRVSSGWCKQNVSLCEWYGIRCDAETNSTIVEINLRNNQLRYESLQDTIKEINNVFTNIPTIESIDWSMNGLTFSDPNGILDLSPLIHLTYLNLSSNPAGSPGLPLILPPSLLVLDVSLSSFSVPWCAIPSLTEAWLIGATNLIGIDFLWCTPNLTRLEAAQSAIYAEQHYLPSTTQTGSNLTHYVLSHLNDTNPHLALFDISSCLSLAFDDGLTSNWPVIVSSSLRTLRLDGLIQLTTDSSGPPRDWLAHLDRLEQLSASGLTGLARATSQNRIAPIIDLNAVTSVATTLQVLDLSSTRVASSSAPFESVLTPLTHCHRLETLILDNCQLATNFPYSDPFDPNAPVRSVAEYWPNLKYISMATNAISGTIPTFANMTQLTDIDLSANQLTSNEETMELLLAGSTRIEYVSLADKYVSKQTAHCSFLIVFLTAVQSSFSCVLS